MRAVRKVRGLGQKGIALVAAIMMIVFATIAVLSVSSFIVSRLTQEQTLQLRTKCLYLAQAGVQNALYWFRYNGLSGSGHFPLGQTNIDANNFFVVGGASSDFLIIDTSLANFSGSQSADVMGCKLQNATDARTITISRMIVTWNNTKKLQQVVINGVTLFTGGKLNSPADVEITDFTLDKIPTVYPITRIRFSGNMSGATVSVQCVMTDGSTSRSVILCPASTNAILTVKATGKTAGSSMYRTIKADYNALTGKIIGFNEVSLQMLP